MSTADLDAAQLGRKRIRSDEPCPHCVTEVIEIQDTEPQSGSSGTPGATPSNSEESRNRQPTESPDIVVPGNVIPGETSRGSRSRRSERLVCVELNEANRSRYAASLPPKAKDKKVAYTCAVCNAVSGTHLWLFGAEQSNVEYNHFGSETHKQNLRKSVKPATPTIVISPHNEDYVAAPGALVKTEKEAWKVAFWGLIKAGCTFNSGATLLKELEPILVRHTVPHLSLVNGTSHRTLRKKFREAVLAVGKDLLEEMRELCKNHIVAISFDGGRLTMKGAHVLCLMIHIAGTAYCLPFMTSPRGEGAAFNSTEMFHAIEEALHSVGLTLHHVRYIMSDAAAVNMCAGEKIAEWAETHPLQAEDVVNLQILATELDDSNDGDEGLLQNTDLSHPISVLANHMARSRHLKCIAHQLVLVVNDSLKAMKWKGEKDAPTAPFAYIKSVNSFFAFTPERRTRFRKFLDTDRKEALEDLISKLGFMVEALDGAVRPAQVDKAVRENIDAMEETKRLKSFLPETGFVNKTHVGSMIEECRRMASDHIPMAFTNDTRWQNSTYRCVEFALRNFSPIVEFAVLEAKGKPASQQCNSLKYLHGLHGDAKAAEREKIKTELNRYLKVFSPVADLIGEFANYQPFQGTQIFNKLCALEDRLTEASQAESPTKEPSAAVLRAFQRRKEHMDLKFWNAVSYLNPGIAAYNQNLVPPAKREQVVMEITSLLRAEIHQGQDQDAEFNAKCREYLAMVNVKNRTSVGIETFWASFPDSVLKVEALAALSVPPIVTLCDSAFSIESSLFTVQQARMSSDVAKAYLTARINGPDFTFGKKSAE